MNCSRHKLSIYTYLNGNSKGFEKDSIALHLEECIDCKKELLEVKTTKAAIHQSVGKLQPPEELKLDIMASINLNKYKNAHKRRVKSIANIGMSMVAAGLVLIAINFTNISNENSYMQSNAAETLNVIKSKVAQPIEFINRSIDGLSSQIVNLNGITSRIEKEAKGGK